MIQPISPAPGIVQAETQMPKGRPAKTGEKNSHPQVESPNSSGVKSRDGDVLELRSGGSIRPDNDKSREEIREWAEMARRQLEEQQLRLLEAGMRKSKDPQFQQGLKDIAETLERLGDLTGKANETLLKGEKVGNTPTIPGLPDYWNAENTANRIVNFATSFAASHGEDAEAFVRKIRNAIADGFAQAKAITGKLPGAAGELRDETEKLTFSKLDKWLEDRRSIPYTEDA